MAVREVRLELGGQERVLRSDLGAWAAIDDAGGDFLATLKRFGDPEQRKTSDVLWLLWAFVQGEPKPSRAEVSKWVGLSNIGEVSRKLVEALNDGAPVSEGGGDAVPLAGASSGTVSEDSPPASG